MAISDCPSMAPRWIPRSHGRHAHSSSGAAAGAATVAFSPSRHTAFARARSLGMKLLIGNKNYSSWSMRPWVLLTQFDIPFEEVRVPFESFAADSRFKAAVAERSPAGKVPVLVDDDGFAVWDSLAIAEYVAEKFPEKALWPRDVRRRARARSVCAERSEE